MGLFSKDSRTPEEKMAKVQESLARHLEKSKAKAAKHGIDVSDAVAVGACFEDNIYKFLVVRPSRIELHTMGKRGSLLGTGAGLQTIPMESVTSAEMTKRGVYAFVTITASGTSMNFRADWVEAPAICDAILARIDDSQESPLQVNASQAASDSTTPAEQLRELAELHKSGILTDEEFASKKTELLGRI